MLAGLAWLDDNAPPEPRVFLLERSQYKVIDNWFAGGLRGTGSKDVEALEQFVPEHRTLSVADTKGGPTPGSEVNPGVLFQIPVFALFPYMLSGVPLGIAEGLIDDFASGSPTRSGRMTGARIAEIQSTQIRLGEATAYARASRLVQVANCLEAQKLVVPDAKTKARYRLEGAYAVEWAVREHDVHCAHGPLDCISAFQAVARFRLCIRNDQFLRFKTVCDLDETRSTRVGGRFAEADLGALDLGDARPGHPPAPSWTSRSKIIDQALGDAERHARER